MTRDALAILEIPQRYVKLLLRPPDIGRIKINTDAGISLDAMKGGAGGLHVLLKASPLLGVNHFPGLIDLLIVEAMALREG
jgi:hypothetical protein